MLVALAGGLLTWQHWSTGTVFGPETGRAFGIVVGIEFLFAGLGCALLSWRGHSQWMSAWVALVVGVHLFPVAAILDYPLIHVVAALVTLAALAAIPLARRQGLAVSAVNGVLVGPVLLGSALLSLGLATM